MLYFVFRSSIPDFGENIITRRVCVTDASLVLDRHAFYQRPRFLRSRPSVVFIKENSLFAVQFLLWAFVPTFKFGLGSYIAINKTLNISDRKQIPRLQNHCSSACALPAALLLPMETTSYVCYSRFSHLGSCHIPLGIHVLK